MTRQPERERINVLHDIELHFFGHKQARPPARACFHPTDNGPRQSRHCTTSHKCVYMSYLWTSDFVKSFPLTQVRVWLFTLQERTTSTFSCYFKTVTCSLKQSRMIHLQLLDEELLQDRCV